MCSSFSKTVAPGLRVGWVAAGGYVKLLTHLKFISTLGSATLPQMAMAEFVQQGLYEKHTRYSKQQYQRGRDIMINWVQRYFPEGTKMSYPQGGLCLWIEMHEAIDSFVLNENLQEFNIGIAPGALFSANAKYKNCLRLNYSAVPDKKIEEAVKVIGNQAKLLIQRISS